MLGSYASILRRRFWLTVLTVAAFFGPIAFLVLTDVGGSYQSTGLMQVRQGTVTEGILGQSRSYEEPERRLATELEILGSRAIAQDTAAALAEQGWDVDAEDVSAAVEVAPRGVSSFIEVVGSDVDPDRAQALTAAFIDAYVDYKQQQELGELQRLEQELSMQVADLEADLVALEGPDPAGVVSRERTAALGRIDVLSALLEQVRLRLSVNTSSVEVLAEASAPEQPVATLAPGPAALLSLLGPLLLGYGIAVLLDLVRDPVRTRAEAQALLDAPVLAELDAPPRDAPADGYDGSARALEAGRLLRLRLRDADGAKAATVLVTTPDAGLLSAAQVAQLLAATAAADNQQVALVGLPDQETAAAGPLVRSVRLSDWLAERSGAAGEPEQVSPVLHVVVVPLDVLAAVIGTSPREVVVVVCELDRTRARRMRDVAEELRHSMPVRTGVVLLTRRRRRGRDAEALVRPGARVQEVPDSDGRTETGRGDTLDGPEGRSPGERHEPVPFTPAPAEQVEAPAAVPVDRGGVPASSASPSGSSAVEHRSA